MTTSIFLERLDKPAAACDLSGAGVATWLVKGVEYPETDPFDEQFDEVTEESESLLATAAARDALLGRPRGRLTGDAVLPLDAEAATSASQV